MAGLLERRMPPPARLPVLPWLWLCALALTACGEKPVEPPAAPVPAASVQPAEIGDVWREIIAAQNGGQRERYIALIRSLPPTKAELAQVLRPGPEAEAFLAAATNMTSEGSTQFPDPPADQPLPKTTRTEVFVHQATTEELAAYEKGSTAAQEFPGGMRAFARSVAQPGRTWFTVELREPGKDLGTRLTCFTRLGERFIMVAKPWRALPRSEGPDAPR